MNLDEIKYSLQNLMKRKMRSFLSVLSILIGITAIFALVSFGLGIQSYVDDLADKAGRDKLYIQSKGIGAPGTDENFKITKDEIDFIGKIKGVDDIAGMYFDVGEIKKAKERIFSFVIGIDPDKLDFVLEGFGVDIGKGRQLKKGDLNKVALGYNYQFPNKLFKKPIKLGDKIEINDEKFEVVGFYEEVGNPSDDSQVYLNAKAFELLYPDTVDEYGFAMIKAQKGVDPRELAVKIEDKLRKYKDQEKGKEDFFVQTFEDALATFGAVINVINGILVLIALVSLVVAFVNIMNTMYTAIIERTKEIGIMKAIGARNRDILFIFVFESGFLGLLGGIFGVLFGYIIASTGGAIAAAAGYSLLKPYFPLFLIISCLLFAFLTGATAGLLPAYQASKLRPVDALRYE